MSPQVFIEGFRAELPPHSLSSLELESLLAPAYARLGFSPGRLEFFTGIRERRYFDPGARSSGTAAAAGAALMQRLGLQPAEVDAVIYCGVCRDVLEPATAAYVHALLGLPGTCLNFDLSNACLGAVNGVALLSDMIRAGSIRRGLVVTGEIGYPLLRQTIDTLNADEGLTRQRFKGHFASLTIGSCAAAISVAAGTVAKPGAHRIIATAHHADTTQAHLCQGDHSSGGPGPLMQTDSEALLHAGIATAAVAWEALLQRSGLRAADFQRCITHQVGSAHTQLLLHRLGLAASLDFPSFTFLGNCGSASLPATADLAEQAGHLERGQLVALLGIGSGINSAMMAVEW